jgi:hypothetical protein
VETYPSISQADGEYGKKFESVSLADAHALENHTWSPLVSIVMPFKDETSLPKLKCRLCGFMSSADEQDTFITHMRKLHPNPKVILVKLKDKTCFDQRKNLCPTRSQESPSKSPPKNQKSVEIRLNGHEWTYLDSQVDIDDEEGSGPHQEEVKKSSKVNSMIRGTLDG